jgi:hypothetical protein
MTMARTPRWTPGAVYVLTLTSGATVTAVALERPYAAFYATGELSMERVAEWEAPMYVLAVHKQTFADPTWRRVGTVDYRVVPDATPRFFMQDEGDPSDISIVDATWHPRPATRAECEGLERAAVWDGHLVKERLEDELAGRVNRHAALLRLK